MRKKIFILLIEFFLFFSVPVFAQEDIVKEQMEKSGVYALFEQLPKQSEQLFSKEFTPDELSDLTFSDILSYIKASFAERLSLPVSLFLSLTGVMLLSSLISAVDLGKGISPFLSAIAVCGVMAPGVFRAISSISEGIESLRDFITSFVPVFAGVCAVSGKAFSAVAYQASVLSFIELYSVLAFHLIIPMVFIYLAFSICCVFSSVLSLDGLAKGIKAFVTWLFGASLAIFTILLTAKTLISGATDDIAIRATKFLVGSFLPVVGSSLNDAYSTVYSGLAVVKNGIGVFGILALTFSFLPMLVDALLTLFALKCAEIAGEILSEKQAVKILSAAASAISIALGVAFAYQVMTVISVAILLVTGR